jgi:LemA protein
MVRRFFGTWTSRVLLIGIGVLFGLVRVLPRELFSRPGTLLLLLSAYGLVAAIVLLAQAAREDRDNWIVEKASPLPIGLLNARDDAWIAGKVECLAPLTVPSFGGECIFYSYVERTTYGRGGSRVVCRESNGAVFDIIDRTGRITLIGQQAEFDGLRHLNTRLDMSHTAEVWFLPCGPFVTVSAVGSVSDDRSHLEKYHNIPLIVTTRTRQEYVRHVERKEGVLRGVGAVLLLLAVFGVMVGASIRFGLPFSVETAGMNGVVVLSGVASLLVFLLWSGAYLFNQLVTYRERVKTAWRQITVDLVNRTALIPKLVEVIGDYAVHERELQELVATLRSIGGMEPGLVSDSAELGWSKVLPVLERYPKLQASELFLKVQGQITALEDKIAFAREFYNDSVKEYDTLRVRFPAVVVARLCGCFPTYELYSEAGA